MKNYPQIWPREKRAEILDLVENHLPDIIPIPERVKAPVADLPDEILDSFQLYALPFFRLSSFNGKLLPALKIVLEMEEEGKFKGDPIVVAASSGNTALNLALLLKNMIGITRFIAVIKRSTPEGKQNQLRKAGAEIQYPPDGMTPIQYARELGNKPEHLEINQYEHPGSVRAHKWTAGHIKRQIPKSTRLVFVTSLGTTASAVGAHQFLRPFFPGMKIVGIASPPSPNNVEEVPGSRTVEGLKEPKFDYEKAIDYLVLAGKTESDELSSLLLQQLISGGLTSGQVIVGFYKLLRKLRAEGRLHELLAPGEKTVVLFLMVDTFLPY